MYFEYSLQCYKYTHTHKCVLLIKMLSIKQEMLSKWWSTCMYLFAINYKPLKLHWLSKFLLRRFGKVAILDQTSKICKFNLYEIVFVIPILGLGKTYTHMLHAYVTNIVRDRNIGWIGRHKQIHSLIVLVPKTLASLEILRANGYELQWNECYGMCVYKNVFILYIIENFH